jgi:hypothetical protein
MLGAQSMKENHLRLFESWREASQKFDYFVAGLIGALVAFVGQSYKAVPLGLNAGTLELLSLLILLLSFWAAFKRIESNTENLRLAFEQTDLEDQLIELRASKASGQPAYGMQTGQPLSESDRDKLIESKQARYTQVHRLLVQFSSSAYKYYHWRNYLLIFGFLFLLVARVLKAYASAP